MLQPPHLDWYPELDDDAYDDVAADAEELPNLLDLEGGPLEVGKRDSSTDSSCPDSIRFSIAADASGPR